MIPVQISDILPDARMCEVTPNARLYAYVRKYQIYRLAFKKEESLPLKYHPPRPEHCITFYNRDPQRFSHIGSQTIITYPRCVINGMYNIPINRHGGYDFLAIKVVLQPGALFCLTGFPSHELTNTFVDAEAFWGKEISAMSERLSSMDNLDEMLATIEAFLEGLIRKEHFSFHPIDHAIKFVLHKENRISLGWLADQSCLSTRQFIRKFEQHMGISAKTFDRIVHFDRAYRMKNRYPELDWLSIAMACGYYDYQHLVKDYKEFTHHTPQSFFEMERTNPERAIGIFDY